MLQKIHNASLSLACPEHSNDAINWANSWRSASTQISLSVFFCVNGVLKINNCSVPS